MAELAVSFATTIFEHSVGAVVQEIGYLWNYKKNIGNLKAKVEMLDCDMKDVSHSVIVAERNAERVKSQVNNWQNNTMEIIVAATKIIETYEENAKKRCLIPFCPNLVSHYQSSRKACKTQIEIEQARTEAAQFNGVADRAVRQASTTLSTEGYLTFNSRKLTLEEIMKTMKDATKSLIGVYGLGGMGKSTLVKQVASRVAEEKIFDEIVMALVTQTPKLKEIQGQIAQQLDLKLEESSVAERAGHIYDRLKEKKILVILDDLWEKLDLENVGIPFGAEHMGCKILITSRFQHVLSSMGTKKYFPLGALEEEEAWNLFEEKTIDAVKDHPALLAIGKRVAKRCAGLPVLIVTVAASLSSRPSLSAWKDALKQLKQMNNKEMHEIVNSAMEFISYKHLEQTHKRLFLLCGLIGSSVSIANLLKYVLGWDLFDEDVVTVEEARNKLDVLILDLKASCLLLDDDSKDNVNMHDIVRGVAISIARRDLNMFSVGDHATELNRWPKDDALKTGTAMVFHTSRNIPCLSAPLECPFLELFIVSRFYMDSSPTIPDTCFEKTRKLKVLDMSGLSFSVLPSSLSFLENLQTFRLDYCYQLEDISILGGLKKLQVLSLVGSNIEELPRGIGQLSELSLLDLRSCFALKVIPRGLIASLSQLEELYMSQSFNSWEAEECLSNNGRNNASLAELKDLPNLRSLEIEVPDAKLLPKDLNFEKLERYAIILGEVSWWEVEMGIPEKGFSRKIGMHLTDASINHLQQGVKKLLERTELLCLRKQKSIKNVVNELDRDGFQDLKDLRIHIDDVIQYIVNVEAKQHKFFPALESLDLSDMLKLKKICNGPLIYGSFCKLTTVKVQNCNQLKSLFSFSMAIGLPCLQEIQVCNCNTLEEIVAKKSREDDIFTNDAVNEKIEFVQLRKLSLECLPQLISFYSIVNLLPMLKTRQKLLTTDVQPEESIPEEEKHSHPMPFFREVSFPRLEELALYDISNLAEIWNDKLLEKSYCNLKSLVVKKCSHLVNIFSSNLLHLFGKLELLNVSYCDLLQEVFVVPNELDLDEEHNGLVPQLIQLSIAYLPKLRWIWSKYQPGILRFKNLQMLNVENCSGLKYLLTHSITMGLVQLKTLTVKSCAMMKEIVAQEEGETPLDTIIFPQLSYLLLEDLPNLTRFCWGSSVAFPSLKDLTIESCQQLEALCFQSSAVSDLTMIRGLEHNESHEKLHSAMQSLFNGKIDFSSLETLRMKKCDSLKYLFTPSITTGLGRLRGLTIKSCMMMKEIIVKEEGEMATDTIIFPQLSYLCLEDLPNLITFYSGVGEMVSNDNIHTFIQSLFSEKAIFSCLETLIVEKCARLKYLFTPSINMSIEQVRELTIKSCSTMKEIAVKKEGETTIDTIIFPQLIYLCLEDLPNITTFYSGVEEMVLNESIHSDTDPFFKGKAKFPCLEKLIMEKCDSVKYLFTPITTSLVPVRELRIKSCAMMKEIVENEKGETMTCMIIFPHLSSLCLEDMPKLTTFYSGVEEVVSNENIHVDIQPLFNEKVNLTSLEKLIINNLDNIKRIWHSQFHEDNSFCRLKDVRVEKCANILKVFPSAMLRKIRSVKNVQIYDCDALEVIFEAQKGLHVKEIKNDAVEVSELSSLRLKNLPKLRCIWEKDLEILRFQSLCEVRVGGCQSLRHVFSATVAQYLHELKELNMEDCKGLETIVDVERKELARNWTNKSTTFLLPKLKRLLFKKLPKLESFYPIEYTIDCVSLKQFNTTDCDKVFALDFLNLPKNQFEKLVSSFGMLTIRSKEMMKMMRQDGPFSPELFRNLKSLIIEFHDGAAAFPPNFPISFHNLEKLTVNNCSFEEIFLHEGEGPLLVNMEVKQVKLIELSLVDQPKLICIWSKYHSRTLNFKNLQKLYVERCGSLKYLFTHSIVMGLEQLQSLTVKSCLMMKEIVVNDEGTTADTIIFPQLTHLYLEDLPNLTRFCWESCILFPSLQDLRIGRCQQLETFSRQSAVSNVTTSKGLEENKSNEKLHTAMQPLFNEKVNFPNLEVLIIENLDNIKSIWHSQLYEEVSLCKLVMVTVIKCANLLKIFPTTMLSKIQSLKKLQVVDCSALEEIFEVQKGLNLKEITNDVTKVSQLTSLELRNLPKLRCIWEKDLLEILSFQSLCQVNVILCENLNHVLPASVARSLYQLEMLHVEACKGVDTIVDDDENMGLVEEEVPAPFMFPKLAILWLEKLPKLECFYPRKHALEWPMLKRISVSDCGKVSALYFLSYLDKKGDNHCQKFFSNLEALAIRSKDMKIIMGQDDHFPPEFFLGLKRLTLTDFRDESAAFSSKFLHRFHNVGFLSLYNCSFQEIFPYEGEEPALVKEIEEVDHTHHTLLLSRLKWLLLFRLPELKYIWKEGSPLIPILEKLEFLQVWECPRLTYLVPGSVSFEFLVKLDVRYCGGLINLIQSSTARSLVQLTDLKIIGCLLMEEIVEGEGDGPEGEIIFKALKSLELGNLPRVSSFCEGNYAFKFPSLLEVTVRQCPKMRTFSRGISSTPMLERVYLTEFKNQERWSGDLNTTIKQLFSKMEDSTLTTTVSSTSSNDHFQPEAQIHDKPTESAGKKIEEIREEFAETRKGIEIFENYNVPRKGTEVCEEVVEEGKVADTCQKGKGKEIEVCEEEFVKRAGKQGETWNRPYLESNVSEKPLAPLEAVASSPQMSPASNRPETSHSLVTNAGTSKAASNSQQKDVHGLHGANDFIPLLSEFLQILQTQPLNSMSPEQFQFIEDAFHDLSNISIDWFSCYVEKARECSSVVNRRKKISKLELEIADIEAQWKALQENKKALEKENEAIASRIDLEKPLHDS